MCVPLAVVQALSKRWQCRRWIHTDAHVNNRQHVLRSSDVRKITGRQCFLQHIESLDNMRVSLNTILVVTLPQQRALLCSCFLAYRKPIRYSACWRSPTAKSCSPTLSASLHIHLRKAGQSIVPICCRRKCRFRSAGTCSSTIHAQ